jgi:uroporphyrinogen decarboxylase
MIEKKLLTVLNGEAVWPPPVWLMRQAGRYLPEYRDLRGQAGFITRCTTPDLATEITIQPIRRFGMDGAILFSDILMVPWALGQKLDFLEGEGPSLEPIRDRDAIRALRPGDLLEATRPIMETVKRVRASLTADSPATALIGFAGAPFTVACYMVEGGGSRDFVETRRMAYSDPEGFGLLIGTLVEATIVYLSAQIEAGAEAVMIFDSWSGILPPVEFETWVVKPTLAIVKAVRDRHPAIRVIGFPRLAGGLIGDYASRTTVDCVAMDTVADPTHVSTLVPSRTALQGNLDPIAVVAGGNAMRQQVVGISQALKGRPHVFNLGHGILPMTPPEHVAELVETLRAQ